MNARLLRRLGTATTLVGLASSVLGGAMLAATATGAAATVRAGLASSVPASDQETDTASSARTQAWSNPLVLDDRDTASHDFASFKDLEVSVSQTANLSHQGITVSWTGARVTSSGKFAYDYLQVMQCWGESDGPSPEQCQWGAQNPGIAALLGDRAGARTLKAGEDPAQEYTARYRVPPPLTNPNLKAYAMPFTPVAGETVTDVGSYFTAASTNEISGARTGADGSGTAVFEVQTALEAPHLGCGERLASGKARSCWLVVVPRGEVNANGALAEQTAAGSVSGSPLSATMWANRMVFPLAFSPLGSSCALGQAERRLVGNELFSAAMTSWQSALCRQGTTFGYSQIGDAEARAQLLSTAVGAAGLAVVNAPLDATATKDHPVLYAPVTQSAVVVAFSIDRAYRLDSELASRDGTPVEDLVLSARLIAKLLTQSYRADVPGGGDTAPLSSNPRSIVNDPELLDLNPEMADFVATAAPEGLMVNLGTSDANAQVWRWIKADPFAAAFLRGEPDEHGMRINPAYAALDLVGDDTINSFPKADLRTYRQDENVPAPGYGTLDLRPYAIDMADAAYRAQRADVGAKIVWDITRVPPSFISSGAQLPGQRFALALTDLASAERYGLRTARLVNAAGQAVGPTHKAVSVAINHMVPTGTPGVVANGFTARVLGAYPLSSVDYAAVAVCTQPREVLADYATFLHFAATSGQVVGERKGQLPAGHIPLGESSVAATLATAEKLRDPAFLASTCPAAPTAKPSPSASPSSTPTPSPTPSRTPRAAPPVVPVAQPTPAPEPTVPPAADPDTATASVAEPALTARADLGASRLGVAGSLGVGASGSVLGPFLLWRGRRLANGESRTQGLDLR